VSGTVDAANKLVLIEKYDVFLNYIYPIVQRIPRAHGLLKERVLQLVFEEVVLLYKAVKSPSVSKIYEADATLAVIRHHLRFLADPKRKMISLKQHHVASIQLAEVGKIIGSIIKGK